MILEPPKIKSDTVSTVSLSISHEVMGPDAMVFTGVQPWLDPGIPSGWQLRQKGSKAERSEAWSNWFTQRASKVCDTELALTTEATSTLSNRRKCPTLAHLLEWVLEAQANKWSQRAPTLQLVILKEEQRRKTEKRKQEWHGEAKPDEQGP